MALRWELPRNWGTKKLGSIAPEDSSQVRPSENPKTTYNYWGLDIIDKGDFTEPSPNWITGSEIASTCVSFDEDNVLYAKLRPYLNKVIVPNVKGIGSTEWVSLKPNSEIVDRTYLAYVLRTQSFVHYATINSAGARLPRVRKEALWDADIPIPYPDNPTRSLDTQRRIVARIEALLHEVREMRALNATILASTSRLLSSVVAEKFRQLEGDEKTLDELCDILGGSSLPQGEPVDGGEVLLLKVGEMNKAENTPTITTSDATISLEAAMNQRLRIVEPGSIIIPKRGGAIATNKKRLLSRKAVLDPNLMAISPKPDSELDPEFLLFWFENLDLRTISTGSTVPQLNRKDLAPLSVTQPRLNAQKQVTAFLNAVRNEINEMLIDAREDQLRIDQLEQSILAKAFQGEL